MTESSNVPLMVRARDALDDATWAYLMCGAGGETTLLRNRLALDSLALKQRVLADVSHIDTSTRVFGHDLRIPVIMSPVGTLEAFHPDGAEGVARACGRFGTIQTVGAVGPDPAEISVHGAGPKAYQVYPTTDRAWLLDTIRAVEVHGFVAIVLTVDVPRRARRERQMAHTMEFPGKRPPDRAGLAAASWSTVANVRSMTDLPLVIKGITSGDDAVLAFEHGADGVWVSNHGGRQLDHGRAALDCLREIAPMVDGRGPVIFDGGVQTGTDVLKAIAFGADLVAVGKLQCMALAAGGEEAVHEMLEVVEDELVSQMGNMGLTSLADLGPELVVGAPFPVPSIDAWSALR